MKRFTTGQRVLVQRDVEGRAIGIAGAVVRLNRSNDAAWIRLDERHELCPFPADDPTRATNVMAFPEDCARQSSKPRKGAP